MTTVERGVPFDADSAAALERAQGDGAAPGTELPRLARIEPSPPGGRRRPTDWRPGTLTVLAVTCLTVAAWQAGSAAWLHVKARVGQRLLERAWHATQASGVPVRPWPWADMHPIARLAVPAHGIELLVLEGANGRTLAWGPGHAERSAGPGARGNAVVTGHRDTHFAFLRDVGPGDRIVVTDASGIATSYRVERTIVADHRALRLPADARATTLSLVTCYPFDGVDPRTPLRYAVVARAD